jgi:hypothetical protein
MNCRKEIVVGKPERKERDQSEDLNVDGRTVLQCIIGKLGGNWMHLAQDRDQWRAVVNMVMNLRVL